MNTLQRFAALTLVLLTGASPAWGSGLSTKAGGMEFAPHKAIYEVKLIATRSGSQIINISGEMRYEWHPTCDAWISNHSFNLYYEYADAPPMQINSDFSTFETFDGKSLDYSSQRRRDGMLFEELRGRAVRDETGKGEAVNTIPGTLSFDLPEGTLFPMQHTMAVLKAFKEGKKFLGATVFDGSDEDGPVEISSFMGGPVDAKRNFEDVPELDMSLIDTPAWKARLAFFPLNDPSETADYEMNLVFHENGIISDMMIEYDDFTISQKLVALESLKDGCKPEKPAAVDEEKPDKKG